MTYYRIKNHRKLLLRPSFKVDIVSQELKFQGYIY